MDNYYLAIKGGEVLDFLSINAIFSAIYTPHTPADTTNNKIRHYQDRKDDFRVINNEPIAILKGPFSEGLTKKLVDYGVELRDLDLQ